MALNFTDSPSTGDVFTSDGLKWTYNGSDWERSIGLGQKIVQKVFDANGTWTPDTGMVYAILEGVGGGGGGGGVAGTVGDIIGALAGGSGGYTKVLVTSGQVGASQTVTIGSGGTGGTAGINNGSDGGNTTIGSLLQANGGTGGLGSGFSTPNNQGSSAGGVAWASVPSGGVALAGNLGIGGQYFTSGAPITYGKGGDSYFGPGGVSNRATGTGGNGDKGGGGAGGLAYNTASTYAGGDGGDGYVVITEFVGGSEIASSDILNSILQMTDVITTSDRALIYDDSATVNKYIDPTKLGGVHLLDSGTASAVSSLDFDLRDYDGYSHFKIYITDFSPSTDGADLWARTSNTASPSALSFDSGASDYSWATAYFVMFGGAYGTDSWDSLDSEISLMADVGNATNEIAYTCEIHIPHNTDRTDFPGITYNAAFVNSSGVLLSYPHNIAYRRSAGYDILGFRLLTSTGTATFKYSLYGYL